MLTAAALTAAVAGNATAVTASMTHHYWSTGLLVPAGWLFCTATAWMVAPARFVVLLALLAEAGDGRQPTHTAGEREMKRRLGICAVLCSSVQPFFASLPKSSF